MKKYIFWLMLTILIRPVFAQIGYISDDSLEFNRAEQALKTVIDQSKYIIEARGLTGDYYYIQEDDQTYYRTLMKVIKVLRGANIQLGDTIIGIWKQEYKGKGPPEIPPSHSTAPRLWYQSGKSTSCLFLTDSKFPAETFADEWSQFKHTTYFPSSIGYFAALFIDENGHRRVSFESGIRFKSMADWYDYLSQFPDVKVPVRR